MLASDRYVSLAVMDDGCVDASLTIRRRLAIFIFDRFAAVSITDNASVIFGGSDAPTALGCLYSIGGISMASNGQIQTAVTDQLEAFGVAEERIYINFFDMDRANVGWSRRTFAG